MPNDTTTPVTPQTAALDAAAVLARQTAFFEGGHTLSYDFRVRQLKALKAVLKAREKDIFAALQADLGKCDFEAYVGEVGFLLNDIGHTLGRLKRWMAPEGHMGPLTVQPSRSRVYSQPLGPTLIIAPWNYPVQLAFAPLVGAIAAGNTAVIKPSELTPASSKIVAEICRDTFAPEFVACVEGGIPESQALLAQPWAHFFYTGGTAVGKIVAKAAAEHLARCTLELGGKSPCIVTRSANLAVTAKRICQGKFLNAGQTCIAPDYLLVERSVHDDLVAELKSTLDAFYGDDPQRSADLARIVNARHHDRLSTLIDAEKVVHGGATDKADRYIAPTLMTGVTWDDAVMQEEIFGPILPILMVESLDDALQQIKKAPDPLAAYLFTEDAADREALVQRVRFGGGCVNNTVLHIVDLDLPFGGIGPSGMGAYHGKPGFDTFSHRKAMLECSSAALADLPVKYPPYGNKLSLAKLLIR